jgi:uncharacterized membrane protein YphA (DoxX/SURF4 family)
MTDLPHDARRGVLVPTALDILAVTSAIALVALVVLGVLPHLAAG